MGKPACVAGGIREQVVFGDGYAIFFLMCAKPTAGRLYVWFISALPPQDKDTDLTRLLINSLAISPLMLNLGFATKTKSHQLRRLAIASYTTVLAAGFSF